MNKILAPSLPAMLTPPVHASKPSENTAPDIPFNQLLSREVAERKQASAPQTKAPVDHAPQPDTNTPAAMQPLPPAGGTKTEKHSQTVDADSEENPEKETNTSAPPDLSSQLLALVANIQQGSVADTAATGEAHS